MIYISHTSRDYRTRNLCALSLSLFNDLVARERERESLRKKSEKRERKQDASDWKNEKRGL
jgi:hypothetical protein